MNAADVLTNLVNCCGEFGCWTNTSCSCGLFCNDFTVRKNNIEHFKYVTTKDTICSQKSCLVLRREEDLAVSFVKTDLIKGTNNPLGRQQGGPLLRCLATLKATKETTETLV